MHRTAVTQGHRDPVTPAVRQAVLIRDGGCVAPYLGAPDGCATAFGYPVPTGATDGWVELDHVRDQPMIGKRAPSDVAHLVSLCHHHHQDGWATANRGVLRLYLGMVQHLPMLEAARLTRRAYE